MLVPSILVFNVVFVLYPQQFCPIRIPFILHFLSYCTHTHTHILLYLIKSSPPHPYSPTQLTAFLSLPLQPTISHSLYYVDVECKIQMFYEQQKHTENKIHSVRSLNRLWYLHVVDAASLSHFLFLSILASLNHSVCLYTFHFIIC